NDRLHRSLSEGTGADHDRAAMVLQRAGDDLRRRRRPAIDKHDDPLAVGEIAGMGIVALRLLGIPAASRDNLAALEKGVGDGDRLVDEPARVVAKIEDITL